MLDNVRAIETPEGMELELRLAGPAVRALAWLLDFLIRFAIYIGLSMVLGFLGEAGMGVMLILIFLLEWFYPVLFEVYRGGATPGKSAMGIKVLQDDGTPVGWPASMVRNLLRAADFLPLFYGFGLITTLLNRDFKRLGDLAAGTVVVYGESPARRAGLPEAAPQPPPVPLSLEEQRALVDFAERAAALTVERREEIAEIARPLTGAGGALAAQRLQAYANWLVGRR